MGLTGVISTRIAIPAARSANECIDEGRTWTPSALQGMGDHINQFASHPVNANAIALGTDGGVYWSDDQAESVSKLWSGGTVTALAFSPDGKRLL